MSELEKKTRRYTISILSDDAGEAKKNVQCVVFQEDLA